MPEFLQSFFLFEHNNSFYMVQYQCLQDNSYTVKVYNTIELKPETSPMLHTSDKKEPTEWQAKQFLIQALNQKQS